MAKKTNQTPFDGVIECSQNCADLETKRECHHAVGCGWVSLGTGAEYCTSATPICDTIDNKKDCKTSCGCTWTDEDGCIEAMKK